MHLRRVLSLCGALAYLCMLLVACGDGPGYQDNPLGYNFVFHQYYGSTVLWTSDAPAAVGMMTVPLAATASRAQ